MKSITFNCVEKLESLLSKQCTQTIHKAWETKENTYVIPLSKKFICRDGNKILIEKPAKFVVGDKVQLYWKKTSKYENFCRECGKAVDIKPDKNGEKGDIIINHSCSCPRIEKQCRGEHINFKKCLGEVEITDVFKIELEIKPYKSGSRFFSLKGIDKELKFSERNVEIPHKDGFKDSFEMFDYFDKNYDLKTPKPFYCYRWRWL